MIYIPQYKKLYTTTSMDESFEKSFHPSNPCHAAAISKELFGAGNPNPTYQRKECSSSFEQTQPCYDSRFHRCSAKVGNLRRIYKNGGNPLKPFHTYLKSNSTLRDLSYGPGVSFERFEASEAWSKTENEKDNLKKGLLQKLLKSKEPTGIDEKFEAMLQDTTVDDSQTVALVFHTVDSLLRTFLDDDDIRNSTFAMDPSECINGCAGVRAMFVCLVLVPRHERRKRRGRRNDKEQRQSAQVSDGIVVIEESQHVFPVGLLYFDDSVKYKEECTKEQESSDAHAQLLLVNKAVILQLLVRSRIDQAAELYREWRTEFSDDDLNEISLYAHQFVGTDRLSELFPGLPSRFLPSEFETRAARGIIRSLEFHTQEVARRQKQLQRILGAPGDESIEIFVDFR
mmetsp:Transcript_6686/g.16686  ORF Transcript_6686/g.16686 Transcript_6686/m.16686 type:complete len:399 (-) Transcript_6686:1192-2388(-)